MFGKYISKINELLDFFEVLLASEDYYFYNKGYPAIPIRPMKEIKI
jgi:hypothetical protein